MSALEFSQILGNYGEFVGAVAIVITLVYLVIQIRQNTRMMRASIRQARSDSAVHLYSLGATSVVAEIREKESRGEALTALEEERMFLWNICLWRQQQTVFFQAQDGLLDMQTANEQSAIVRTLMQYPSARRFWADQRHTFDSRFVARIDDTISNLPEGARPERRVT
jgi:hypothetical protein